ncbi:MAG: SulP family inorganic anion transporter, partial [Gammaproteobacteria bacterium]
GNAVNLASVLPAMLLNPDISALLLGIGSLAIIVLTPKRLTLIVPSTLIAILVGTVFAMLWLPDAATIGAIPRGLPELHLPRPQIDDISLIIRFALTLAFLGSIDSLLTSLVADSITRSTHDSNRELIGQGAGNLVAGLIGAVPGAGATMRTLVNIKAGGKTRRSGMIHAVALLAIVLLFSEFASHIPLAVLAGILLNVGFNIIDWPTLRQLRRSSHSAVAIMLTTLLLTVFVDLMTAVAAGIVMASVQFVAKTAEVQIASAKIIQGADQGVSLSPAEASIMDAAAGGIVLFQIEGPLSFGSARDISWLMHQRSEKDALVIDMSNVPFIDSSAVSALDGVISRLAEANDRVFLFGVRPAVREVLQRSGLEQRLGADTIFTTRLEALTEASAFIRTRHES